MKRRDIINNLERTLLRLPITQHYAAEDRTASYVHHIRIGRELYEVDASVANNTLTLCAMNVRYQHPARRRRLYEGSLSLSSFDAAMTIVADNCTDMV